MKKNTSLIYMGVEINALDIILSDAMTPLGRISDDHCPIGKWRWNLCVEGEWVDDNGDNTSFLSPMKKLGEWGCSSLAYTSMVIMFQNSFMQRIGITIQSLSFTLPNNPSVSWMHYICWHQLVYLVAYVNSKLGSAGRLLNCASQPNLSKT